MSGHDHHTPTDADGHNHARGESHSHGHSHGAGVTDERRIGAAFLIIGLFMIVEIAGGLISGSLALLADGGHMVSDTVALGMSWLAIHVGKRPADIHRSYGYQRIEVLAAFVNGCTLFVIAAWIVFEAVQRFALPVHVLGGTMLIVAVAGLLANIVAFFVLNGGNQKNLNMRSAWLHVLGDVLGFVVAIVAAGVILGTGWMPIDPLLSIFVAVLILKSAYGIVKSSAHILLEGVPEGFDIEGLRADLTHAIPEAADVHHVHAWSLTSEKAMVTLHVRCAPEGSADTLIAAINARLKERYGITHTTIQVEPAGCADEHHG